MLKIVCWSCPGARLRVNSLEERFAGGRIPRLFSYGAMGPVGGKRGGIFGSMMIDDDRSTAVECTFSCGALLMTFSHP